MLSDIRMNAVVVNVVEPLFFVSPLIQPFYSLGVERRRRQTLAYSIKHFTAALLRYLNKLKCLPLAPKSNICGQGGSLPDWSSF